jgi:hypothetical protein
MPDEKQKSKRRSRGLAVVWGGIAVLALGYLLLAKGSITLAPILIIGSFAILAAGILLGWD